MIKATVAGITTIRAPKPMLKRKLVNEGVIIFNPVLSCLFSNNLRCVVIFKVF